MKKTPLYNCHIAHGGKLVEFAGYELPIRYEGLKEEHMAVRNSVGVFDVSHMGEFIVKGSQAIDLVSYISSNDPSTLEIGQAQLSCMPNSNCGIIDDLLIYRIADHEFMLVVNGANVEKDWEWINSHNRWTAELENQSDQTALLAVQGPKAAALLQKLTDCDLSTIPYYTFRRGNVAGIEDIIISATGYTGSGGFELYVSSGDAEHVWNAIFNSSSEIDVFPAGLGARDTLRLEAGFCLYGNDIDETTSPYEAGLGWVTKMNHEFIGKDRLVAQKEAGLQRRLSGFKMKDKGIPRAGYNILNMDGEHIGKITSGTQSPMLGTGIGMGYINVPYHKKGTEILIQIRKKQLPALVTRPPFVDLKKL